VMSKIEDESLDALLWACGYQPSGYQPIVRVNDRLYELVRQQDETDEADRYYAEMVERMKERAPA
jgi:hypothetical protein